MFDKIFDLKQLNGVKGRSMRLAPKLKALMLCFLAFIVAGCNHPNHISRLNKYSSGYIQVNQGKLFYQEYGSGIPIIVLHGGPGLDQGYLLPQMLEFAKDHRIIFYDQRGSGKSLDTKLTPSFINMNQFVQDLETVRMRFGLKKFVLLGHSWGGLLAMNYAIKYPDKLSALILLNTAPADYQGVQAFFKELKKRTLPIKQQIKPLFNSKDVEKLTQAEISQLYKLLFSVYFFDRQDIAKLSLDMTEKSAKSGLKVLELMAQTSSLKPTTNLYSQLRKLKVPILIVHGKQDIVPLWTAKQIHDVIPHSQFIPVEECGHFVYIEKPDQLSLKIRNFLTELQLSQLEDK